MFRSEHDRARRTALLLTVVVCAVLEVLLLLLLAGITGSFARAAVFSFLVGGPFPLWIGPPLYRYILKASE
jgi:hypothetical protein